MITPSASEWGIWAYIPFMVGMWPVVVAGIASLIGRLLGGRKSMSQKELEALQAELLKKKLAIANLISTEDIKQALGLAKGAMGALPMGFGMSAQDPRQQAMQKLLSEYSQPTPPKCPEGFVYRNGSCKRQGEEDV